MKKIIIIFLISTTLFSAYKYTLYGSVFRSCEYTEIELTIIPGTIISMIQDADIVTGANDYACTQVLSKIDNSIFEKRTSNSIFGPIRLADKEWEHIKISNMRAGTELKVVKAISVRRHSILTSPRPYLHIFVEDENGKTYDISIASLGINRGEETISIKRPRDATGTVLTYDNFNALVLVK